MEKDLCSALARELMNQHGLWAWIFKFDRAKERMGQCSSYRKVISLSWPLVDINPEHEVRITILHEIAHALTPGDHHGELWQAKARELGIHPSRCFDDKDSGRNVQMVQGARLYVCIKCAKEYRYHRMLRRAHACKDCANKYFNGKFVSECILEFRP